MRTEFRRLEYFALKTIMEFGTDKEASQAKAVMQRSFNVGAEPVRTIVEPSDSADPEAMMYQLQRDNEVLLAKPIRAKFLIRSKPLISNVGSLSRSRSSPSMLAARSRPRVTATPRRSPR
jgi:hypothetical protein